MKSVKVTSVLISFLCVPVFSHHFHWMYLVFKQPTQRTFDYVLVAHKIDDDTDQKAQRQKAFVQQLEKKNISVTVSLIPSLFPRIYKTPSPDL